MPATPPDDTPGPDSGAHADVGETATVRDLVEALGDLVRAHKDTAVTVARELGYRPGALPFLLLAERRGRCQLGELAHDARVDLSVASRQVTALVDAGLLRRTVSDDDRRARVLEITDEGRALVARGMDLWRANADHTFAGWSPTEFAEAVAQLRKVVGAIVRSHAPEARAHAHHGSADAAPADVAPADSATTEKSHA